MSARAGVVVTGTEVVTGRVTDRNGPWISERLRELGVDHAGTIVVGDRPRDMAAALRHLGHLDLIVTSGGLGPTADDITAEVVAEVQGRPLILDEALERRIWAILEPMLDRWPGLDHQALRASNRKQALVPEGATVIEPVGTAPGLVVPPRELAATVLVLPGPPRELQPMWRAALATDAVQRAIAGAEPIRQEMLRLFGIPESEIAETLRVAERDGVALDRLEITTCLRRGEVEIVTRYAPADGPTYESFAEVVRTRHADTLFSDDGSTVDEQVAALLRGRDTLAVAESCTGGLLGARVTALAGSSEYFAGGLIVYSDAAKTELAGVDAALIAREGAVSQAVAEALADGAAERLGASLGVGVTGIAGPGGGSEHKPVGTVWLSIRHRDGRRLTRRVQIPGGRDDVRDRSTTVAMHLLRRLLIGAA